MRQPEIKPFLLIEGVEISEDYINLDGESDNHIVISISSSNNNYPIKSHKDIIKLPLLQLLHENQSDFFGEKQITFVYYITSEPKTLEECNEEITLTMLGFPESNWYHSYSDLTGYLWTTTNFNATDTYGNEHDLDKEFRNKINEVMKHHRKKNNKDGKAYLTLEIRAH